MSSHIPDHGWIWIIIQNPGQDERIAGQYQKEADISFIPAFLDKEDALKGLLRLSLDPFSRFEVQAIHYQDLRKEASRNGFAIFLMKGNGEIIEKIPLSL